MRVLIDTGLKISPAADWRMKTVEDRRFNLWCGDYPFGKDSSFFPKLVAAARRFSDKEPEDRADEERFREVLENLRAAAPTATEGLVDQVEHRWRHPHCPKALYVLTCTLLAPDGGALVSADGELVPELVCTKVGEAKRTVAARLEIYTRQKLGGVVIADGSLALKVLIYGEAPTMLLERDVQAVARSVAPRAEKVSDGKSVGYVGDETYAGIEAVQAIASFARSRVVFPSPAG